MKNKCQNNKGITIIALAVTVVILIILAGIGIAALTGDNSTIRQAQKGKEVTEIEQEKENLNLAVVGALEKDQHSMLTISARDDFKKELDKYIGEDKYELGYDVSKEQYKVTYTESGRMYYVDTGGNLQGNSVMFGYEPSGWTNESTKVTIVETTKLHEIQYKTEKKGQDGEVDDWTEYTGTITLKRNQKIYVRLLDKANGEVVETGEGKDNSELVGKVENIDKISPVIKNTSITKTTHSITVSIISEDGEETEDYGKSGIKEYRFSKDRGVTWTDWQESSSYAFIDLKQTTDYNVKVEVKDEAGNVGSKEERVTTETVPGLVKDSNVVFKSEPSGWTNNRVVVTTTVTTGDKYTIETKTGDTDWEEGNVQTYGQKGTMYARLKDSIGQVGSYASYNVSNIDKIEPQEVNPRITVTTNSIKIEATTDDGNSTVEYGKSGIGGYRFSIDGGNNYTEWQTVGSYTFKNLLQATSYETKVQIKDNAGNIREVERSLATEGVPTAEGNITFQASETKWTNKDITVTASASKIGYTIETSTDGEKWSTTNPITFKTNGTMYARLVDSEGQSGKTTSYDVTVIDKLDPEKVEVSIESTPNSITINATAFDAVQTKEYAESGIDRYRFSTDGGATWSEWRYGTLYVITGLESEKTYNISIQVEDRAGNMKTFEGYTATTGSIPNAEIKADITEWTNGSVTLTASTKELGYTIETSLDSKIWEEVETRTFTENKQTMYARLVSSEDETGNYVSYTITNIDKTAPEITITANPASPKTKDEQGSINIIGKDEDSKIQKIEWYYKKDTAEKYEKFDEEVYKEGTEQINNNKILNILENSKVFSIYAVAYDLVGNSKESNTIELNNECVLAELYSGPDKTEYIANEQIDYKGIKIKVYYGYSKPEIIDGTQYATSTENTDASNGERYKIKVKYNDNYTFNITTYKYNWYMLKKDVDGKTYTIWYYYTENGKKLTGGDHYLPNNAHDSNYSWFYFKSDGTMFEGWRKVDSEYKYYIGNAPMTSAYLKDGKEYMEKNKLTHGSMIKNNWAEIMTNGEYKWYRFDNDGYMYKSKWLQLNNIWYYFKDSGAMCKSEWLQLNKVWYYFKESGAMCKNESITLNGKTYNFNSSGACTNP